MKKKYSLIVHLLLFLSNFSSGLENEGQGESKNIPNDEVSIYQPSKEGLNQMKRIVEFAKKNYYGGSEEPINFFERIRRSLLSEKQREEEGKGKCFQYVWRYLYQSGYGKIRNYSDLPAMKSDYAKDFSEFLNTNQENLDEAGLVRIDNMCPEMIGPHDSRIPIGAIIVVGPKSYGTSHEVAGDISIKAGKEYFINDQPRMDYGTKETWFGELLGVYVPR